MSPRMPTKWSSRPSTPAVERRDRLAERVDALAHPGHLGAHLADVDVELQQVVADLGQDLDRLGDHAQLRRSARSACHVERA